MLRFLDAAITSEAPPDADPLLKLEGADPATIKELARGRGRAGRGGHASEATTRAAPGGVSSIRMVAGDYCSAVRRSHRWTPRCNNTRLGGPSGAGPPADAPTAACLVTGVGRSGTMHTASVLSGSGWNVDHDRAGSPLCPCPGRDGSTSHMYSFRRHPRCVYAMCKTRPIWRGQSGSGG